MNRQMIEIFCANTNSQKQFPKGVALKEIAKDCGISENIVGAFVNNKIKGLDYEVYNPKTIDFIDITNAEGMRMYINSLSFVLQKAIRELYPQAQLKIEHSISKGFYCELEGLNTPITNDMVFEVGEKMRDIIKQDLPFERKEIETPKAIELFKKNKLEEKVKLFDSISDFYTPIYKLGDVFDYFYGYLVPSTGYLKVFDLVKYYDGMLLLPPKRSNPQEVEELVLQNKLFDIFQEYKEWGEILDIGYMGKINEEIQTEEVSDLIKISEALHEKKLSQIADTINNQKVLPKLVLIAGPSSSGKTTFAKRLAIQLKVAGLKPVTLSLDNYFVDRDKTPLDDKGEYDFEALEAIDIEYFNNDLTALCEGKEIELPKFSFLTGKRYFDGEKLQIDDKTIIIAEGIHALNPKLTYAIKDEDKFNIYVSALTTLSLDNHNRIPTTDTRLIRRIIRDFKYRGYSASETINRWASVRSGEEKHIFPHQENAAIMFNTAIHYELGVLKKYAEPILNQVSPTDKAFREATRLINFFKYISPIQDEEDIPPTSILREFLGGSSFKY